MKRRKIYKLYALCLAGLMLVCLACSKETVEEKAPEYNLPEVKVHTAAVGKNGIAGTSAMLLFWKDDNFHNNLIGKLDAKPDAAVSMTNNIDFYKYEKGETFSTGLKYPDEKNMALHATGYAPFGALQANGGNYQTLTVGDEYRSGKTDFLCCDGNYDHRGTSSEPFTEEIHELKFRHLLSHIKFVGKRDPTMFNVISVNNVKITLHNAQNGEQKWFIPTEFTLHCNKSDNPQDDKCTYIVSDSIERDTIRLFQENQNYIPADTSGVVLQSCYVHQTYPEGYDPFTDLKKGTDKKTISLTLDISADFSWYNGGNPVWYETPEWLNKNVEVKSTFGDTMLPGCEYVVYITFKREGITLQGVQQAWEDGGIHYLPVVPGKQETP